MMTIKLYRGHTLRIVEATSVEIFPCGKAAGSDADPALRTNKVREVYVITHAGATEVFYIAEGVEQCLESVGESHFWNGAYIENAHGATTETVRPY